MSTFRASVRAALMEIQQGRCAVCPSTGPLVVDHDHETGLVRGLLCRGCNVREGQWESGMFSVAPDPLLLAYLANPPAAGKGWLWDYPDPRRNPARAAADLESAFARLATVSLPSLQGQSVSASPAGFPCEPANPAADEAEIPVRPSVVASARRKRRKLPLPVSDEEAARALQAAVLPPLPPLVADAL